MDAVKFPNHVDDSILSNLSDLARRAVDGTVKPVFVDYQNFRIGFHTTAPTKPFHVSSTAQFDDIVNFDASVSGDAFRLSSLTVTGSTSFAAVTATTLSVNSLTASGNSYFGNVTAGAIVTTGTADVQGAFTVTGTTTLKGNGAFTACTANTIVVTGNTDLAGVTASTIQLETALGGVGNTMVKNTIYADNVCKGWINFNAVTDAIADSFNVLSITDGAAGFDTINWDLDFATASYSVGFGLNEYHMYINSQLAGSIQVAIRDSANNAADTSIVTICAFGDQ